MGSVFCNNKSFKLTINQQTNHSHTIFFNFSSEMANRDKKNEAGRRFRENEKLHELRTQADIVRLEWEIKEYEKKIAFERGRTHELSRQVNSMTNACPNDPNLQKAKECLARNNESYFNKNLTKKP